MRQGINPSQRKQIYAILFEYPWGIFYKFAETETEKEAKKLAVQWAMKLEKEENMKDLVIREITLVSSLRELKKFKGLVLNEKV